MYITPVRVLPITYTTQSILSSWSVNTDPFPGFPYQWNVDLVVTPQPNSFPPNYFFDGNSINIGDWISTTNAGLAVKIIAIHSNDGINVNVDVEDVDRFNTFTDATGNGSGNIPDGNGILFSLGDNGLPILSGQPISILVPEFQGDILTKFMYRNYLNSYRRINQIGHTFNVGDLIYIDNTGVYQKATATGPTAQAIVGYVNSIGIPDDDWFTWRPHGTVVENISPVLPGTAGQLIYLDSTVAGGRTTTPPNAWSKAVYIQLTADGTQGLLLERNIDGIQQENGYSSQTYQVADITARNALLPNANIGDQVFVANSLGTMWGHYIKTPYLTTGQWTQLVQQSASTTDSQTESVTINYNSSSPSPFAMMNPGTRVVLGTVTVITPFTDATATLTIGDAGSHNRIMDYALLNLQQIGVYEVNTTYVYTGTENGSPTPVDIPISVYLSAGTSTAGQALVSISYS
jgi:hypothetical protein